MPKHSHLSGVIELGREVCGTLADASAREWLVTNGIGGFASGTVAGMPTRRYHGLLIAALQPPLGRTLLVGGIDERADYAGSQYRLGTYQWASGAVDPNGHRLIERFGLEGTTPVWTYALADALLEKRVFMARGRNATVVRYRLVRGAQPVSLELKPLVNYRDYHGATRADGWTMRVEPIDDGLRVSAYDGARPLLVRGRGAAVEAAHDWYLGFALPAETERGLSDREDHLHAGTLRVRLDPGAAFDLVASAEPEPIDASQAWAELQAHEAGLLGRFAATGPAAENAPEWIRQLVLAADQFIVARPTAADREGRTVIAGYHWFSDWGRDTMISLPGLLLTTGNAETAARILRTFAQFLDQGMLPNRFPDAGEVPEYNTVDATLWYLEAIRAYHQASGDDLLLAELFPSLEGIIDHHLAGTRYRIRVDPSDGLLAAGEPGVQLTWMDAKVGDWVVTPRIGKPIEINALWYQSLRSMAAFARRLGRPDQKYSALADRVERGFERFWNPERGYCFDVLDGPSGPEPILRPNQIYAVALPDSPLSRERRRAVVDACALHLLSSHGLRSQAAFEPGYRGRYGGAPLERDGAYHTGTVWGFLLGPFALAHHRVYGDRRAARALLEPMADLLRAYGLGTLGEIFEGDPPFRPVGCIAQAWTVAETLRAWIALSREPEDELVS